MENHYTNATILIVDDTESYRVILRSILEYTFGCIVQDAKDPFLAFKMIEEAPPDIILLDLQMPKMDGKSALLAIRNNPVSKNIPVIVISSLSYKPLLVELAEMGISDYIVKPFDRARVVNAISKVFARLPKFNRSQAG